MGRPEKHDQQRWGGGATPLNGDFLKNIAEKWCPSSDTILQGFEEIEPVNEALSDDEEEDADFRAGIWCDECKWCRHLLV